MIESGRSASALRCVVLCLVAVYTPGICLAQQQGYYPNQEVKVDGLPSLTAKSRSAADVLATSLEIILRDPRFCCGKNSALEDSIQSADPKSLNDIAAKLQGRHLLSDGRPIMVAADLTPAASVNAAQLIGTLRDNNPFLMEWNSHLYVVYGVVFDQTVDQNEGLMNAIHKLLLLDVRFTGERREISFDRLRDDWGKVQGVLTVRAKLQ